MAQVYSAPPAGGLFNIPDTLPQGLLHRYKKISNLSRNTHKDKRLRRNLDIVLSIVGH